MSGIISNTQLCHTDSPTNRCVHSVNMSCSIAQKYPAVIRNNTDLICLLSRASPSKARQIIKTAPNDLLKALSLIAYNIVNGHFVLEQKHLNKLTPYAQRVRHLAKKSLSGKKRRGILMSGGFLPALLGVIGATLAPKLIKTVLG